ncbi:phosphatidylglycerophosphatase and protein-tyrosine phosphatase 1 [Dipodomys spectabilis]|uniref:phosphatidylglycerophosphatase and protein-tyrosine phosphatase 1 n=1 Tax=Dipodomys spectabilis TaxID=105255 RepID=UPI001C54A04F|nr:phosphatidylglycerophosphatase and protein-tyrosine phosphatase 1 [Dipodomys spectabilis]
MVSAQGAPGPGRDAGDQAPAKPAPTASPSPETSGSRPRIARPGTRRSSLPRPARSGGMAATAWLQAGLARVLFYPTLLYTVFRGNVRGPAHREWYHRIDATVLLGALPLRGLTRRLVQDENVGGVITMNEKYETRFLCNSSKEWKKVGVERLRLSTIDMTGVPTLANLHRGVQFVLKYQKLGKSVYVHCKAGRSRSATMVAAYLIQMHNWSPEEAIGAITKIRSHIYIRPGQLEVLKKFHKEISARATENNTSHRSNTSKTQDVPA